jgi:hypothetical protein
VNKPADPLCGGEKDKHEEGNSEQVPWRFRRSGSAALASAPTVGPSRHRIDFLYEQRFDPEVPIEDVGGAVRDFISGCWPTVWCATCWTELTALSHDRR